MAPTWSQTAQGSCGREGRLGCGPGRGEVRPFQEFCWKGEKNGQAWERKRRSFEILQEKDLIFRGKK